MRSVRWTPVLGLALASLAWAQARPYIGFAYPAGGRQGTTFTVKVGGQGLDGVDRALVTGAGVTAKVVEYHRKLGNQEMQLLREQLNELKKGAGGKDMPMKDMSMDMMGKGAGGKDPAGTDLAARLQRRLAEYVNQPACASISSLVFVEVTIAPEAEPGARELRLGTPGGVSNPLAFHVGQLPETARKPLLTCNLQVLGKEEQALRKGPPEEAEQRLALPCTANGQIAPGEVNAYRFQARKGQRLVISAAARQLLPYIADAVPGWFQPVLAVCDARGKELAYNDDFRFKPDPTLSFVAPQDGEYRFTITDAIYRGREDFVYRVTAGELPYVTNLFPLGGPAGAPGKIEMKGWNLEGAELMPPPANAGPGVYWVAARRGGIVSNRVPFALDSLPECLDKEPNDSLPGAQKIPLPVIVNGRLDRAKDVDVFRVEGRAGETIVAEATARRLDSPVDSSLKATDSEGRLLAFNDDHQDPASGANTHHADSYLTVKLPADGVCFVHLTDTARQGGEEYGYRLRVSAPRPDFELRVVPSGVSMRSRGAATLGVYAIRKDGFAGDIRLGLKNPPEGFSSAPVSLAAAQEMARLQVKTALKGTGQPVRLVVEGRAKIDGAEVAREAVPAEDRMQAFLWRHLVPAEELKAVVADPSAAPPPKRVPSPAAVERAAEAAAAAPPPKPEALKFTKQQVAGRLRQLRMLFEEGLLTDDFYLRLVAECEAVR